MSLSEYLSRPPKHRFAGRAGALQDAGDGTGLVRELGQSYAMYHSQLQSAFQRLGGLPPREDFVRKDVAAPFDVAAYAERGGAIDALVHAEAFLRWCVGRAAGQNRGTDESGPLITTTAQIRSMTAGSAHDEADTTGAVPMPDWGKGPSG